MLLDRLLLGALFMSVTACTAAAPPVVAPPVISILGVPTVTSSTGPELASQEMRTCMEQARVAAMVHARPGQPYPVADGCLNLVIENTLSPSFIVTRVLLVLDKSTILDRIEPAGAQGPLTTMPVFRAFLGPLAAGEHMFQVLVGLQGDGTGPGSYLREYRFEVRSSHSFTVAPTGGTEIRIVPYEAKRLAVEERPGVRYVETTRRPLNEPAVAAPPSGVSELP